MAAPVGSVAIHRGQMRLTLTVTASATAKTSVAGPRWVRLFGEMVSGSAARVVRFETLSGGELRSVADLVRLKNGL